MSGQADYVIIGGGLVGMLTALELYKTGARIVVADAGIPQASWAAGGILSPLPPWGYADAVSELIKTSVTMLFSIINEVQKLSGIDCNWNRAGMLVLPSKNSQRLAAWRKENYSTAVPVRWLAPLLATDGYGEWLPAIAQLQPRLLLKALRYTLRQYGVAFYPAVQQVEVSGDRAKVVRLQDGSILQGSAYVLCAGAASEALCPPPAPPVTPMRGQILLYAPDKPLLCTVLREEDGLYLSPRSDGLLVGSTCEDVGFDNRTTAVVIAALHRRACELFPALRRTPPINAWSGLRPMLHDNIPVIDRHPKLCNFYLNTGHSRYGISMAPAAARRLLAVMRREGDPGAYAFRNDWTSSIRNGRS
ncbi:FAD-dependent oxidoreductase [Candidatus Persebacteraceae bacterium Df01]|uniref:FAD-dependent oxidoreductase n=1 Tax=Candidatus Doriopsillibacter californiensis TaxID=2970740 RepID=A0ABT7QKF1_9GAMM|nr:FAD-dependent oxidoreductase [Candidatus Persebacteraceae bacterium Df01]